MIIFGRRNKDKKDSKQGKKPETNAFVSKPVLGVNLKDAVINDKSFDGILIPAVVRYCIDYVMAHGIDTEGIYRVSPNKSRLDELELLVNSGERNRIPTFADAHEAAGLLKRFLRQLPEHILTAELRSSFESTASECKCNAQECCTCQVVNNLKELLEKLPMENYSLLAYVFRHAQLIVQKQKLNKMSLAALGVLLQAMLVLSRNEVRIFLMNAANNGANNNDEEITRLFSDVDFKPYVRPKSLEELKEYLPPNIAKLKDELKKQQCLLENLCEQTMKVNSELNNCDNGGELKTGDKEIYDIQTAISLLKEKLRLLEPNFNDINDNASVGDTNKDTSEDLSDNSVNSALLEKQLLAVQISLKEEIANEKRRITQLLSRLREVRQRLPPEELERLNASRNERTCNSTQSSPSTTSTPIFCPKNNNQDLYSEKYTQEKKRRDELVAEVIRLRNLCAELRSHLEHDTVLLNNSSKDKTHLLKSDKTVCASFNTNNVSEATQNFSKETVVLQPLNGAKESGDGEVAVPTTVVNANALLITRF